MAAKGKTFQRGAGRHGTAQGHQDLASPSGLPGGRGFRYSCAVISHRIVAARKADGPALRRLEEACFAAEDVFKPRQVRYLLGSPTCRVLVVRDPEKGILAEVVALLRHSSIPSGRIYKIAVHPSAQGRGLARRLLAAAERLFRRQGMRLSVAEVRTGNAGSRALFEHCGYVAGETLPAYYPNGEDGLKYRKPLVGS